MLTPKEAAVRRQVYFESEYEYVCQVVDRFLSSREGGWSSGNTIPCVPGEWHLSLIESNGVRNASQAVLDRVVLDYTAAGWLVVSTFDEIIFSIPVSEDAS